MYGPPQYLIVGIDMKENFGNEGIKILLQKKRIPANLFFFLETTSFPGVKIGYVVQK
jgi:hypothetical protein